MSAQLGVGVRVYVGWCPDSTLTDTAAGRHRLKRGTIESGPYFPGESITPILRCAPGVTAWVVDVDTTGRAAVNQAFLFPIDDGDPPVEIERADKPEEVTS